MAGKPKNRLELRRQYEAAEPLDPMEDEADDLADESEDDDDASERRSKKKKVVPKAKAKTLFMFIQGALTQARIQNNLELLRDVYPCALDLLGATKVEFTQ